LTSVVGYNEKTRELARKLRAGEKPNGDPVTDQDLAARWRIFRTLTSGFWNCWWNQGEFNACLAKVKKQEERTNLERTSSSVDAQRRTLHMLEILKKGDGILSTVGNTRKLTLQKLAEISGKCLDTMLLHGTTTVEIKSGYGLDVKNELKILKTIQHLQRTHCMDIVPTFLGAHAIPSEYKSKPDAYIDLVCAMLSKVKPYATFCDVFCDDGGFNTGQSERILSLAKRLGFKLKIHVNEFKDIGGVSLAIKLGVVSADHLDNIEHRDILKLKKSHIICVLLPGVPFFLMKDSYAPARKMIEKGLPVALATDFNPGTCPTESMQMMLSLACLKMDMTPAQAINAATINAAYAVGMPHRIGSIETGKQADMIILDIRDYNQLPYYFGINHVETVIKKGKLVVKDKQIVDFN